MAILNRVPIALACLSFLIGLVLSAWLLRFLFGTSIYTNNSYRGLMAPSYYFLSIGRVSIIERALSDAIDAIIFGAIIFVIILAVRRFLSAVTRFAGLFV